MAHCVTWGPSSLPPPEKGAQAPIFGPCLSWPNGRPSQQLLSTCLFSSACQKAGKQNKRSTGMLSGSFVVEFIQSCMVHSRRKMRNSRQSYSSNGQTRQHYLLAAALAVDDYRLIPTSCVVPFIQKTLRI